MRGSHVLPILVGVFCLVAIVDARIAVAGRPSPSPAPGQVSASLVLAEDLEGRFIVRNAANELIAEVYKPAGRPLTLSVDPGVYDVRVEREKTTLVARVSVAEGAPLVLDRQQLGPPPVEAVATRTTGEVLPYAVTGRS